MSENRFMGAPESNLAGIGRVVVSAARVEVTANEIADALGIDSSGSMQYERLARAIRSRLNSHSVPSWATIALAAIIDWTVATSSLMRSPNDLMHSAHEFLGTSAGWIPTINHIRTGASRHFNLDDLLALSEELKAAWKLGLELHLGLLYQDSPGVYRLSPPPLSSV
jgi:hypothetical protein